MSLSMGLRNNLGSEQSGKGLTDLVGLWSDCPLDSIRGGSIPGVVIEPNLALYQETATTVENACGLPTYEGDCTIKGAATVGGGVALFCTTDNEGAAIQIGGDTAAPIVIPADSASGKKMWFEAEIMTTKITSGGPGWVCGLAGHGASGVDVIADAGNDLADIDFLGFWMGEGQGTVDVVTQKTGAAFDKIKDTIETMVASTYSRLGFVYDPLAPDKRKIKFYVNGVPSATYVGENSGDATVYLGDTTNFPGGEEMSPIIALKAADSNDATVTVRALRCVQLL